MPREPPLPLLTPPGSPRRAAPCPQPSAWLSPGTRPQSEAGVWKAKSRAAPPQTHSCKKRVGFAPDSLWPGTGRVSGNATSWIWAEGPGAPCEQRLRSPSTPGSCREPRVLLSFFHPAHCLTCPDRPCSERCRISGGSKSIFCRRAIGHFGLPVGKSGREAPGDAAGRAAAAPGQSLLTRPTPTRREQEDFQRCSILSCRPARCLGFQGGFERGGRAAWWRMGSSSSYF